LLQNLAVQEWLLAGYYGTFAAALVLAGPQPGRARALAGMLALAAITAAVVWPLRRRGARPSRGAILTYRVVTVAGIVASYLLLRDVLPIVNPRSYDAELRALDLALFGGDPVLWLDRFVTPGTTEWFAFFYYCYFPLMAVWVVPMVIGARDEPLLAEFALGVLLVVATGHVLYMVVPGWGPHYAFAAVYPTPLPAGFWLERVLATVAAGGALKDIFPSLHTALPAYFLLFAVRHRRTRPFDLAWPPTAFVTANIMVAALFLRWHYLVDVIAGFALALAAHAAARRIACWERTRRTRAGVDPVWPPLNHSRRRDDREADQAQQADGEGRAARHPQVEVIHQHVRRSRRDEHTHQAVRPPRVGAE
jgi:hypothetical protein